MIQDHVMSLHVGHSMAVHIQQIRGLCLKEVLIYVDILSRLNITHHSFISSVDIEMVYVYNFLLLRKMPTLQCMKPILIRIEKGYSRCPLSTLMGVSSV